MVLSLGVITIASGALLGWVYDVTKAPIAAAAAAQQTEAIAAVLPAYDNDPEGDVDTVMVAGRRFVIYPAKEDGRLVGVAVKGSSMEGFGGEIAMIAGFDADGKVRDYRVLQQAETPGLGSKMEEWFRDPQGARSVIGKSPEEVEFTPTKDGGDIDAITAATISSRAFLGLMRDAFAAYKSYQGESIDDSDVHTGASKQEKHHDTTDSHTGASKQEKK